MSDDRNVPPEPSPATTAYPLSRLSAKVELVDVAREIQHADAMISATAAGKLQVIAEQIRALQAQAEQVLAAAQESALLHRARCTLQRRVGHTYYLYRKSADDLYFSLLSPEEWGNPPDPFVGAYRLEADMSWIRAEDAERREAELAPIRALLAR